MKCETKYCRNTATKKTKCAKCVTQHYRLANPIKYAFDTLKHNAKRRGKYFDLTIEQFTDFAKKVGYLAKNGIYKYSYHIDRIDESKGYEINNIQALTNSENVRKYKVHAFNEKGKPCDFKTVTSTPCLPSPEIPF